MKITFTLLAALALIPFANTTAQAQAISANFTRISAGETVVAPHTSISGTPTVGSYSGLTEIIVSGTGNSFASTVSDAFYYLNGSLAILDVAVRYKLPLATEATRAAFAPVIKKLSPLELCRAVGLGVPGISAQDAEAKLRDGAKSGDKIGDLALGLFDLKKTDEANALLAKFDKEISIPSKLILYVTPETFIATVRRMGVADPLTSALFELESENRDTPKLVLPLCAATEAIEPDSANTLFATEYRSKALSRMPRAAAAAFKKQAAAQKAGFLGEVKQARAKPAAKDDMSDRLRQKSYANVLVGLVPLDPTFVKANVSVVTAPAQRARVVIALANYYAKK